VGHDAVTGAQQNPAQLDGPGDGPADPLDRGFVAQELIQVAIHPGRIAQPSLQSRIVGQADHDGRDRIGRRAQPAEENDHQRPYLLLFSDPSAGHAPVH